MGQPYEYKAPDKQVTEIRVHGVGGTPPEILLGHPHPEQVAGDDTAGFFRHPAGSASRDVEAYSWGGLTSRNVLRSLWLLLLPFALANVAGWMVEVDTTRDRNEVQRHAEIEEWLTRIAAALLTVGVIVWSAAITVDLIAFRCGSQEACREGHWWLEFLGTGFFRSHPLAGIALGALVPLVVLGILARLSKRNRKRYDEFPPFAPGEAEAGDAADLRSERFWYRPSLVADLAAFHGAAGSFALAAVMAFTFAPFFVDDARDALLLIAWLSVILAVIAVVGCACLRPTRTATETPSKWRGRAYFFSACLGVATVLGLSLWGGLVVTDVHRTPTQLVAAPRMPFYVLSLQLFVAFALGIVHFGWWIGQVIARNREGRDPRPSPLASLVALAVALAYLAILLRWPPLPVFLAVGAGAFLVVIFVRFSWVLPTTGVVGLVTALGSYWWKDTWIPGVVAACLLAAAWSVLAIDATWPRSRFRWGGATVPSLVAVLLVAGVFTGLATRLADFLDAERSPEQVAAGVSGPAIDLDLLPAYDWYAVSLAAALAITAFCGIVLSRHLRSRINDDTVELAPPPDPLPPGAEPLNDDRKKELRKRIAGSLAFVRTISGADVLLTYLAAIAALALLRGIGDAMGAEFSGAFVSKVFSFAFWRQILTVDYPLPARWEWLVTPATWLLAALPLAMLFGLRRAVADQGTRRKVGVIWDVATFWPRRFHPFAPPSYSERAVPELQERIKLATQGGRSVVLAAHSQGSIVAYAAVASSPVKGKAKIVLATYGSPLSTLYGRYFPNYFRLEDYRSIAAELEASNQPDGRGWKNFYRATDPIGGPVFKAVTRPLGEPEQDDDVDARDVYIDDPWWAYHRRTQPLPPLLGHSDYMDDPTMKTWIGG